MVPQTTQTYLEYQKYNFQLLLHFNFVIFRDLFSVILHFFAAFK